MFDFSLDTILFVLTHADKSKDMNLDEKKRAINNAIFAFLNKMWVLYPFFSTPDISQISNE